MLRPGTTFDDVLGLYVFDRKLRLHLLDAIERVEVTLRASISDHLSRIDGPHWYENPKHFKDRSTHSKLLADVDEMLRLQRARRPESGLSGDRFISALDHQRSTIRGIQTSLSLTRSSDYTTPNVVPLSSLASFSTRLRCLVNARNQRN